MRSAEIQIRVNRLLDGTASAADLDKILLFLRDRSFGRPSVREFGDFVAHSDQREKGLLTEHARDFFRFIDYKIPNLNEPLQVRDAPASLLPAMQSVFRQVGPAAIWEATGLGEKAARMIFERIIKKFEKKPSGRIEFKGPIIQDEYNLIRYLSSIMVVRPIYQEEKIIEDLMFALQKNKFATETNFLPEKSKLLFILWAVTIMHQTKIKLYDGHEAWLRVGSDRGLLSVRA